LMNKTRAGHFSRAIYNGEVQHDNVVQISTNQRIYQFSNFHVFENAFSFSLITS